MEARMTKLEEKVTQLTRALNTIRVELADHILKEEEDEIEEVEIEEEEVVETRCTRLINYIKNRFC